MRPIEIDYDGPRRRKSGTLVSAELLFSRNCILFAKTVLLRREHEPNARMEHKRQANRCQKSQFGSTSYNRQTLCFRKRGEIRFRDMQEISHPRGRKIARVTSLYPQEASAKSSIASFEEPNLGWLGKVFEAVRRLAFYELQQIAYFGQKDGVGGPVGWPHPREIQKLVRPLYTIDRKAITWCSDTVIAGPGLHLATKSLQGVCRVVAIFFGP